MLASMGGILFRVPAGGSEITTYDSLDMSLGQARRNSYIAMKSDRTGMGSLPTVQFLTMEQVCWQIRH